MALEIWESDADYDQNNIHPVSKKFKKMINSGFTKSIDCIIKQMTAKQQHLDNLLRSAEQVKCEIAALEQAKKTIIETKNRK